MRKLAFGAVLALLAVSAPPSAGAVAPMEWSDPDRVVTVAEVAEDVNIDLGPDGTLYVLDRETGGLSAVDADGRVEAVPGTEQIKAVDVDVVEGAIYLVTATELWGVRDGRAALLLGGLTGAVSVVADPAGNVYVADTVPDDLFGARIRGIAPDGTVTVVAGIADRHAASHSRAAGSPAAGARLKAVRGLAVDSQGRLYFTDDVTPDSRAVLTIDAGGALRFVADAGTIFGNDGADDDGLAVGADGRVYVLDTWGGVGGVRVLGPDDEKSTAGPNVFDPEDIALHPSGDVYLAARGRILSLRDDATDEAPDEDPGADPWADREPGTIRTVAGPAHEPEGPGRLKIDYAPQDIAVGTDGAVHVVENGRLRTMLGSARVSTRLADLEAGSLDVKVQNIAPAAAGAMYVRVTAEYTGADANPLGGNTWSLVLLVHPDREEVQILVGGPPLDEHLPNYLGEDELPVRTSSAGGRLYVSDQHAVRSLEQDGSLRTVAEKPVDEAFTVDSTGAVYYFDDHRVFRVAAGGEPQPIAGTGSGATDAGGDGGPATAAAIDDVRDIAVAPDGTVYLATGDGIRAIGPDDTIATVRPDTSERLAVDAHGNLYFADKLKVRVLVRPGEVTEFPWPLAAAGSAAAALVLLGSGFFVFRARRRRTR